MTFTIFEIALGVLAANLIAAAAIFIHHRLMRPPKFKYYGCVTGCDNGREYHLVDGQMEPAQCIYCLEVEVQRRHPQLKGEIIQYTKDELQSFL